MRKLSSSGSGQAHRKYSEIVWRGYSAAGSACKSAAGKCSNYND
jgi:hypothetical protein